MKSLSFAALVVGMIALASCTKEEVELAVAFEEVPISELCPPADESMTEETFIITTAEDYAEKTGCMPGAPEIDFSKRYVMGGWKAFSHCASLDNQELRIQKTTLHYEVDIRPEACTTLDTVYFMVSLPLGYKKYETEFHVNVR